ncbi:hypothetical protein [Erysipelothrix rhusiopathiae]|uniref:hypothetical protein n=1 Tax=Erysipelothrix rhusiopathiae TaxID=1648 RepID=UPI002B243D93|nr:hypothetical protein [Erysipelothrix rhusiopathiae]WRB93166.1 hypothetical protein LL063_00895 [Erysipelothrix rhusiopathiae]
MEKYLGKLNEIVEDTKKEFGYEFANFKGFEFSDKIGEVSDGRYSQGVIIIPIEKIDSQIKDGTIVKNLQHELMHAEFERLFPQIHEAAYDAIENEQYEDFFVINVFVEYYVHKMGRDEDEEIVKGFLKSFENYNFNFRDELDQIKFKKYLPYLLYRVELMETEDLKKYISNNYVLQKCIELHQFLRNKNISDYRDDLTEINSIKRSFSNLYTDI